MQPDMRGFFLALAGLLFTAAVALAQFNVCPCFPRNSGGGGGASFTPAWQTLKIGGGGQLNGLAVVPLDGTIVNYTNTYGGYLYRASGTCNGAANNGWGTQFSAPCWEQLVTASSVSSITSYVYDPSVYDIEICPGNTNDAYMLFNTGLWVTTNLQSSARTWAKLPTVNYTTSANQGAGATGGTFIACDPNNVNVVYVSVNNGFYKVTSGTSGGGATVASLSVGSSAIGNSPNLVVVDPLSATSGGVSQHFWVYVQANGGSTNSPGLYETYNGGTGFTKVSGSPTSALRLKADKFSQAWFNTGASTIYKYVGNGTAGSGTLSQTAAAGVNNSYVAAFAFDPSSSSAGTERLVASYYDGNITVSTNGGSAWCSLGTATASASGVTGQPGWLGVANQGQYAGGSGLYLSTIDYQIDPSGNLWNAAGLGAWELTPSWSCSPAWQSNNTGIEQLVGISVQSAPGTWPLANVWDKGVFTLFNPDLFPASYWPGTTASSSYGTLTAIEAGWALDQAVNYSSPKVATGAFTAWVQSNGGGGNAAPVSTTNGGVSWTVWPATPAVTSNGGVIAATSSTDWLGYLGCYGCDGGPTTLAPAYTTNSGTSWTNSTMPAYTQPISGGGNSFSVNFPIAADRGTAGAYCLEDAAQKFYYSTNNGSSFTAVSPALTVDGYPYIDKLIGVPGQAGQFLYSAESSNSHLWKITKTTTECDTATELDSNLNTLSAFGFGAPKPGNSYPTIYAYGLYGSTLGMYESDNGGTSFSLISAPSQAQTWPSNSIDYVRYVSGDPNVYGRIYVTFNGSGYSYIDTTNACPWVDFTNSFYPSVSLTGTVTLQAQHSGLVPVTSVSFYVDGTLIGTQTTGSGTPTTYSQSWVTGGVATGAHTLQVTATGNGCSPTSSTTYANFSIPITTH